MPWRLWINFRLPYMAKQCFICTILSISCQAIMSFARLNKNIWAFDGGADFENLFAHYFLRPDLLVCHDRCEWDPTLQNTTDMQWILRMSMVGTNSVSEWQRHPGLIFPIIRCSLDFNTQHSFQLMFRHYHRSQWHFKLNVYSAGFLLLFVNRPLNYNPSPPVLGLEERDSRSSQVNVKMAWCSWEISLTSVPVVGW